MSGVFQQRWVDQRQFGGAGIAEDIFDAFAAQHFEENIGATAGRDFIESIDVAGHETPPIAVPASRSHAGIASTGQPFTDS